MRHDSADVADLATGTVDDVVAALEKDGYATIPDAITADQVEAARRDLEEILEHTPSGRDDFEGRSTRRVYALFAKTRALDVMATHPVVLSVLDKVLGDYQLSAPAAISIGPGEVAQPLHPDDAIYPMPRPHQELVVNVMWPLQEFTEANGATRMVAGSHRWIDERPDDTTPTTTVEMPPRTALVYLGSVWHGGGANHTDRARLGVVLHYASAWLRPVENHVLAVPPAMARTLPTRLQELLGYNIYPPFIGYVDGRHPRKLLTAGAAGASERGGRDRRAVTVHVETDGPVTIVTLDRPEVANAIDRPTATELADIFRAFDTDATQDVAVLTGAGGTFCAGADLKAMSEPGLTRVSRVEPDGDGPVGPTRMLLDKPVIAAVEGHAVAGGLELAAWCDLRVAAEDAVFGVYCRRWGIPLMDGGTIRLTRLLGHSHALDLILTGRGVSGEEALRMGLANRIVSKGDALAHAVRLAHEITSRPQAALRHDRMSSYEQWSMALPDAISNEYDHGMATLQTGQLTEGLDRYRSGAWRDGATPGPGDR